MRRRAALGITLGSLVVALVCTLVAGVALAEPVVIEYYGAWSWGPWPEIEQRVVDRFNELYEGRIRVEIVPGSPFDWAEPLVVRIASGVPPAVAKVDRFVTASFAAQGLLYPLDEFVARDGVDLSRFFPPTLEEAVWEGSIYGFPWSADNRGLYYNRKLFDEAGLDRTAPPLTWEEASQFARRLDHIEPNGIIRRVGFAPHLGNWYFGGWLWSAGGDVVDETSRRVTFASEEGIQAAEWMQQELERYGVGALDRFYSRYDYEPFVDGTMGMFINGSWFLSEISHWGQDLDFGVAAPPRPDHLAGEPFSWSGGWAMAIPTGLSEAERQAAWEFLRFYTMDEWAQTYVSAESGQIPPLREAATSPEFLDRYPEMLFFVGLMEHSRFRPQVPVIAEEFFRLYSSEIRTRLEIGGQPARLILEEVARAAQARLDEAWERVDQR